ncbi:hypothetical protein L6R46_30960, partial [Myxococcota bacterium]|nr:hypothetical protein [Myxococcota bacterium]
MTQSQIEELREEHETIHRRSTDSHEMKELRHQIEKQLVSLENFLRDNRGFLHKKDIFEIEQALKRGRMALLKSSDKTNLDDLSMYLARFFAHLADKAGGGDTPVH